MVRRMLRAYLSLTRGERNGFYVLALLIFVLGLARLLVPVLISPRVPDFGGVDSAFLAFRSALQESDAGPRHPVATGEGKSGRTPPRPRGVVRCFPFDPNQIPYTDLLELGLPESVARTLVNYRNSGGKFIKKTDLMKVYGLGEKDYLRLEPYISLPPLPTVQHKSPGAFELNSSDTAQLKDIYGIGRVYAARIISYRDLLGGFYSHAQLKEVYGLEEQPIGEIKRRTVIDTGRLIRMDLNTVDRQTLARHPYLSPYHADALLAYREFNGGWKDFNEIVQNNLLPDSIFRRIRPYLKIGK